MSIKDLAAIETRLIVAIEAIEAARDLGEPIRPRYDDALRRVQADLRAQVAAVQSDMRQLL